MPYNKTLQKIVQILIFHIISHKISLKQIKIILFYLRDI